MSIAGRQSVWVENAAPTSRWPPLRLRQIWDARELLWFLAVRDVKVRYKQALLGVAWAGVQPLVGAVMFTVLFQELADVELEEGSYFAFALVGYSAWTYFSTSVATGTNTLLYNAELLTKVAFPRIVAPLSALLPGLIDLAIGAAIALGVSLVRGDLDSPAKLLLLVPGLALLVIAAVGPVLLLSATIVRYRDVGVIVTFGLQLLLFASPVAYPPTLVPEGWRTALFLNPVSGAMGLLRTALIGADVPTAGQLACSVLVAVVLATVGLVHFRRSEREFADII